MAHGLIVAVLVTVLWVLLQNAFMHVRRAKSRVLAMIGGYVFSLPFVWVAFRFMPVLVPAPGEAPLMGLVHAYVFHLLLFLLYVECFYHVERSVTLRFLVEIMRHGERGERLAVVRQLYDVKEMILRRLDDMLRNGFVEKRDGRWHELAKGRRLAQVMQFSHWLFQSKSQHERM